MSPSHPSTIGNWPKRAARPVPREDEEGLALFTWARTVRWNGIPLSDLLIFVPNGAYLGGSPKQRSFQMVRMKQQGFQPGVSDYLLPVPIVNRTQGSEAIYGGLWMELKRTKGGIVSDDQQRFLDRMRWLGFRGEVVRGFDGARACIEAYLRLSFWPLLVVGGRPPEDWPR